MFPVFLQVLKRHLDGRSVKYGVPSDIWCRFTTIDLLLGGERTVAGTFKLAYFPLSPTLVTAVTSKFEGS